MRQRVERLSPLERIYAFRSRCTHTCHRSCLVFKHQNSKHLDRKSLRVTAAADTGSGSHDHRARSVQSFLDGIQWDDRGLVAVIAQASLYYTTETNKARQQKTAQWRVTHRYHRQ